jgi:SOS-response transcriptional repressor LexA
MVYRTGQYLPASQCSQGEKISRSRSGKKRSWRPAREITGSGIPLVGDIADGVPIDVIENVGEELRMDATGFGCDT